MTVLLNSAMVAERSDYLQATPYERSAERIGYANGFKGKSKALPQRRLLPAPGHGDRDGNFGRMADRG